MRVAWNQVRRQVIKQQRHFSTTEKAGTKGRFAPTTLEDLYGNDEGKEIYDVVVVGGGVVGSSLACQLKSNPAFLGKKVAVIENLQRSELPTPQDGDQVRAPDLRVFSITPASKKVMEDAQAWQKINPHDVNAYKYVQAWDAMGEGFIRFDSSKIDRSELGYIVEQNVLVNALNQRMDELTQSLRDPTPLKVYCPSSVKHFRRPNDGTSFAEIDLADGTTLKSSLVVAADGSNSLVRTMSALGTWGWEYDQKGVVATIKTDRPNDTAWQRFYPTGPVALLPMRDGFTSIVWSCNDEMAKELTEMSPEAFKERLNHALHQPPSLPVPPEFPGLPIFTDLVKNIGGAVNTVMSAAALQDQFVSPPKAVEVVGKRAAFPLKLKHATTYVKPGVALVGDSAHSIHPLAGQGLNLGLADVNSLSKILIEGVKNGEDLSSIHFLTQYENDRKASNVSMALVMDGFKRLFGPNPDPVGVARNIGMGTLNGLTPLKNQIMKYAMGLF